MKGEVLGIVIVLAVLSAGAIFFAGNLVAPPTPTLQSYENDAYGTSFSYPTGYILSEKDVDLTQIPPFHEVTIISHEDAVPRLNSEGPTDITVDFYTATSTLEQWIASPLSNFGLGGDGRIATTTIEGDPAVSYTWSGLYDGNTVAILHNGKIITLSVTYFSTTDDIVAAYETVLQTLQLR